MVEATIWAVFVPVIVSIIQKLSCPDAKLPFWGLATVSFFITIACFTYSLIERIFHPDSYDLVLLIGSTVFLIGEILVGIIWYLKRKNQQPQGEPADPLLPDDPENPPHPPTPPDSQPSSSSARSCMLPARRLQIDRADDPEVKPEEWEWISMPHLESSSSEIEVAKLIKSYWLEIVGRINAVRGLTANTNYNVSLVFKLDEASEGLGWPFYESVISKKSEGGVRKLLQVSTLSLKYEANTGVVQPIQRDDGWMEVLLGKFFNSGHGDEKVKLRAVDCKEQRNWEKLSNAGKPPALSIKFGLIVRGMEFTPI